VAWVVGPGCGARLATPGVGSPVAAGGGGAVGLGQEPAVGPVPAHDGVITGVGIALVLTDLVNGPRSGRSVVVRRGKARVIDRLHGRLEAEQGAGVIDRAEPGDLTVGVVEDRDSGVGDGVPPGKHCVAGPLQGGPGVVLGDAGLGGLHVLELTQVLGEQLGHPGGAMPGPVAVDAEHLGTGGDQGGEQLGVASGLEGVEGVDEALHGGGLRGDGHGTEQWQDDRLKAEQLPKTCTAT